MALQYFYGSQSEQFSFYRIPKVLFTDERYRGISMEAKVLYGLMLDRVGLSRQNGWMDEQDRVYIIYSIEDIMSAMGCGNKKVSIYLNELEKDCGLIERKRRGFGLPNIIYVKNFIDDGSTPVTGKPSPDTEEGHSDEESSTDEERAVYQDTSSRVHADTSRRVHPDTSRNVHPDTSRSVDTTHQDVSNGHANDTELSDTEMSDNKINNNNSSSDLASLPSLQRDGDAREEKRSEGSKKSEYAFDEGKRAVYRELLAENLELEPMLSDAQTDADRDEILEIFELILDTVCTGKRTVRICGEEKPAETVRSRFLKLNGEHLQYVMDRLAENTTEIRSPKQYLLAALYNAPMTMGNHYKAMVSHDWPRA